MSCSKNPQKDILGKWELVSIYEFKDNGIVVVSNRPDEAKGYSKYMQEYSYRFAENPSGSESLCVVIDEVYYDCCISNKLMYLDSDSILGDDTVAHHHFKKL